MDITLSRINEIASPDVVARGRAYFHDGRVQIESASDAVVRATVDGSELYTVELHDDGNGVEATCTCPFQFEGKCKHIVAAMLALLYQNAKVEYSPTDAERRRRAERRTSWVQDIKKLLVPAGSEGVPRKGEQEWRLAYSLRVANQRRTLVPIKIKTAKDGTDGTASVLKRPAIFRDQHFDAFDRVVLEKLATEFSSYVPQHADDDIPESSEDMQTWGSSDKSMSDVLTLLVNKELYLAHQNDYTFRRLHVSDEPARIKLGISESSDGGISVEPQLEWNEMIVPLPVNVVILAIDSLWILFDNNIAHVADFSPGDFVTLTQANKRLVVPARDRSEFMEEILPRLVKRFRVHSELSSIQAVDATPKPRIYMSELNEKLNVELRFMYDTVEIPESTSTQDPSSVSDLVSSGSSFVYVHRKPEEEMALSKALIDTGLAPFIRADGVRNYVPVINPFAWLLTKLPRLGNEGFELFGRENLKRHRLREGRPRIGARVSSGIDWFDLHIDVKFGQSSLSFSEIVEAAHRNDQYVRLDDGTVGILPEQWLKKIKRAIAVGNAEGDGITFARAHLGLLNDITQDVDEFDGDKKFEEMRKRLQTFRTIKRVSLPKKFNGKLRPYQKSGVDWLNFLREFGVGGILADDMGLGKTVQALVLLQKMYEDGAKIPSLIVVPTSPLFNWQKEIERFTPTLRTLLYAGVDRNKSIARFAEYDCILTSYGILRRDLDVLKQREFLYVVLDESQNIKNPVSINAQAARALQARHRLALTGTPVENNLNELWSQFAFLNPGMLGSERTFTENFAKPIEKFGDEETSNALKQLIFPFVLRRTKELVATELPPKVESTVYCDMDPDQQREYEKWRQHFRESILKSIDTVGLQRSKIKVLEGLMRLRQVCCHPALVDPNYNGTAGKFDAFIEMLEDILAEGHKVLVFSQFVKMLDILRRHCDKEQIVYEYLDGSTRNRRERVERFQEDENVKLFLISLKAGGTGLNLTAADYVIHYDPWWNPAVEMQATDRTHRIGQTKQVFAYKLITRESVEEKILALQEKKQALVKNIITTDSGFMKTLTKQDVEALFG